MRGAALRLGLVLTGPIRTRTPVGLPWLGATTQTLRSYGTRWLEADGPTDGEYTGRLEVNRPGSAPSIPAFRLVDEKGHTVNEEAVAKVDGNKSVKIYRKMALLNALDRRMTLAETDQLISFYLTSYGEEACQVGSAAALHSQDLVFAQYREPGVLVWRGMPLETLIDQCFGNIGDPSKGRQMPIHYGSRDFNYVTISSTVGTQTPHAVGAAYAYKNAHKDACVVTYFGEGGTSTGDAHAAMNFASTLKCPVVFFCRNNRFAISTPIQEQMRCDGVVERAHGYGMWTIRVDGNDALAVHEATATAREITMTEKRPVLIEAMTYRVGDHSSNVDACGYRDEEQPLAWGEANNPFVRLRNHLTSAGLWNDSMDAQLEAQVQEEVDAAFERSVGKPRAQVENMFMDVYDDIPPRLRGQRDYFLRHLGLYADEYPSQ